MLPKSKGAAELIQLQLAVYQVASHIALSIASALDKLCRSLCNTLVKIQADLSCFSFKITDKTEHFGNRSVRIWMCSPRNLSAPFSYHAQHGLLYSNKFYQLSFPTASK
jgi:hypothetical protein